SAGVFRLRSASSVARTMLYGFDEPWLLATTFATPITSKIARIGPPAMMPVPSGAGLSMTFAAPCRPSTWWCSVPLRSGIFTSLRRASSIAFWTATGTSRALPLPMPMRPSPSPTTVSAAKPRMRPPLTTLVTRFTAIIFSRNPSSRSSPNLPPILAWIFAIFESSELQAGFARRVGERLHAAMEAVTGTVERDAVDARGERLLRDALADQRGRTDGGAATRLAGELVAQRLLERGGAQQHALTGLVDDARVDMRVRAVHREPTRTQLAELEPGLARPTQARLILVHRSDSVRCCPLLLLLDFLEHHALVGVPHALALVGLGFTIAANVGSDLADDLLVGALDHDLGRRGRLRLHAGGQRVHDRVREAEREVDRIALHLRPKTRSDQLQTPLEALR